MASQRLWVSEAKQVPLGRYWRSSLLVLSLVPRSRSGAVWRSKRARL